MKMRRDLAEPVAAFPLAEGLSIRTFVQDDASALHALMTIAYESGGGGVLPLRDWWPALRDDPEFSTETCWLVVEQGGRLVGAGQCWTSGFIKDLVVHPDFRRQHIASCLLAHIFASFRERGLPEVCLKVLVDNRPAIALYSKHGMHPA